jgi:hypothetical protein
VRANLQNLLSSLMMGLVVARIHQRLYCALLPRPKHQIRHWVKGKEFDPMHHKISLWKENCWFNFYHLIATTFLLLPIPQIMTNNYRICFLGGSPSVQVLDTLHCLLQETYLGSEHLTSQANSTGSSIIQGDHDSTSSIIISSFYVVMFVGVNLWSSFSINGITPILV